MTSLRRYRRGTALLIVLATLLIAVTSVAVFARTAATAKAQRRLSEADRTADELLLVSGSIIDHWLVESADDLVLPPDAAVPATAVIEDELQLAEQTITVRITAWDQRGLLRLNIAGTASPLRSHVPPDVLRAAEAIMTSATPITGLDQVAAELGREDRERGAYVFPAWVSRTSAMIHREPGGQQAPTERPQEGHSGVPERILAFGDFFAARPKPAGGDAILINPNTAPLPLVEAALRQMGRGGIEVVRQARTDGKHVALPTAPPNASGGLGEREMDIEFVVRSDAWAFRTDIVLDGVQRSWWSVYHLQSADDPSRAASPGPESDDTSAWRCVQRCAIFD